MIFKSCEMKMTKWTLNNPQLDYLYPAHFFSLKKKDQMINYNIYI